MKIGLRNGLFWVDLLVLLCILVVLVLPNSIIRIILGVPFVLFFPGFALITTFYPRRTGLGDIERVALSIGLSIAVVPLIGLVLNYTPWGIHTNPVLLAIAFFTLAMSAIAWWRQALIPEDERFIIRIALRFAWPQGIWSRALYAALIVVTVGSIGTIGYVAARPKPADSFTEFYILGPAGKATDYPKEVHVGSSASVTVGVANHLRAPATYRVEITVAGVKSGELAPFDLASGQQREQPATFTPTVAGTRQPVEFILYKDGQIDSSLKPLRLWIDVVP